MSELTAQPEGSHGGAPERVDELISAFLDARERGETVSVDAFLAAAPAEARETCRARIEEAERLRDTLRAMRPPPPDAGETSPEVRGFRVESLIGKGGLGRVYLATDLKLDRQVALKVLARSTGETARARILGEARKAARLRDHGIVTIYSVVDEGPVAAIVMERVEGFPIDRAAASLTWSQRARLLRDVARALAVAHASGIIHRDLKPENVLVTPEHEVKILDFGLAASPEEAADSAGRFQGTPVFASPEQARGEAVTTASDIFSFGSLMFQVLAGRPPFRGDSVGAVLDAIAATDPPFLRDVADGVPEDLQAICLACLARDPAKRPAAADVQSDLGRYLLGEPVRLRPALYRDTLRGAIAAHANDLRSWARQGMISEGEFDRLDLVYRRILADEDHWIVDARRVSLLQLIFYTSAWTMVVAAGLLVWLARGELSPVMRVLLPAAGAGGLVVLGVLARVRREWLASASFLAGAVLAVVPAVLSFLGETGLLAARPEGVTQLLGEDHANSQILVASAAGLVLSIGVLASLRLTGFAWTTALLVVTTYLCVLLVGGWLDRDPEIQALWCLPLVVTEGAAIVFERRARVRWAAPFHLVALAALVGALDVIAVAGPTLELLGLAPAADRRDGAFLDPDRQVAFSLGLNGVVFLATMLVLERSPSLDLRRGARLFEVLAPLHLLGPLYMNVEEHRGSDGVSLDLVAYLAAVAAVLALSPWRSRWRFLLLGLGGVALGAYLVVDLEFLPRVPFLLGLGVLGLAAGAGAFAFLRRWGHS